MLNKGYGKGNDVWALGILAFELISGYTPFGSSEDDQRTICKKIVRDELLFPKDCYDTQGMQMIAGLLDKNVGKRLGCNQYGIMQVRSHPWFTSANFSFSDLYHQKLVAPWLPKLTNYADSSHFEKYDENYPIILFRYDGKEDPFAGF